MALHVRTALAACTLWLLLAAPAGAKLFTVTTEIDSPAAGALNDGECQSMAQGNPCTLRAALQEANGSTGDDEIALPARNYVLSVASALPISSNVTINGEGPARTIVDAGGDSAVFSVSGGTAAINRVAITGGGGVGGSGVAVSGTTTDLTLDGVAVRDNVVTGAGNQFGGGLFVFEGRLTVRHSAIYDNKAQATGTNQAAGGGVYVNGTATSATFDTTTIANNRATSDGGTTFGGGISTGAGTTLRHVTMVGNLANTGGNGGNLYAGNLANVAISNSVITDGTAVTGPNCAGSGNPAASSKNLAGDTSCKLPPSAVIASGALEAFGDHGGPTRSAPPKADSPALDIATSCPDGGTDQRGQAAPIGPACDLGAAELGADLSASLNATASSVDAGDSLTYVEVLRNNGLDPGSGTLEFTPPAGTSVNFASSLGGSCAGSGPVLCTYGTLAPGASFAATIVLTAPASGPITATARASGPVADFDTTNNLASVTTTVVPAPPPPDSSDKTKPILGGLRLSGKLSRKRGGKLRYVLSEKATLTIRLGKLGTQTRSGKAGEHTLKLSSRWAKKRPKRGKKYKLTVVATDAAGNKSAGKVLKVRVRR